MQRSFFVWFSLLLALAITLSSGCGRKPRPAPLSAEALEQQALTAIDQAFNEARNLMNGGQTNAALAGITAVAYDPRFQKYRHKTFPVLVQFLLEAEQADEAKRLVAQACTQDPANAPTALDILHDYLMNREGQVALAAWAAGLAMTPSLPVDIQRRLYDWRLAAAVAQQDDPATSNLLAQTFNDLPPADAVGLAARTLNEHLSVNRLDAASQVLTLLLAIKPQTPELAELTTTVQVLLTANRGDWTALPAGFASAGGVLADRQLQGLMRQIIGLARKAARYDTADAICETVVFKQPDKVETRSFAARCWAENAMTTNRVDLPRRLNVMLEAKLPATEVGYLFQRHYYNLINEPALLKAMCDLGEKLVPLLSDKDSLKSVKTMILDGAFIREDYDAAILRLEAGIPDRDEAWHKMALCKVKAHRALKNNQPREAVQFFREFMACVQTVKEEDTSDPSTRIQHTKEMILGRNAKRIAEILVGVPDPAAAAKAYAEARGYYRTALEKANPETRPIIEAEMAQLP